MSQNPGRRILPAVPPIAGKSAEEIAAQSPAIQAWMEAVLDALDNGTPAGVAEGTDIPTTVDGTATADPGIAPRWARADHQHDADVSGTPGAVAATAAQGTGTGLARTNHSHRFTLLTTKGDLAGHNGTDPIRVAVGATNGHVLTVDSSAAAGVAYKSVNDAFDPSDENVVLCQQVFGRW